jgi:hypothetical protein
VVKKKDSLATAAETMIAELQGADPGRVPAEQAGRLMATLRVVSETEQADRIAVQGRKVAGLEKEIEAKQAELARERKLLERMIDERRYQLNPPKYLPPGHPCAAYGYGPAPGAPRPFGKVRGQR